jgi:hypothetical protein
MPSKIKMLKEDVEFRWKILILIKETLMFYISFERPNTEVERFYVYRDLHLRFISLSLWRLLIIELSKLFGDSENQKYNVLKLLRKLAPSGEYRSLRFDEDTLNRLISNINQFKSSIDEVSHLRDNYYAHSDRDPFEKIDTTLTLTNCEELTSLAEEVIRTVGSCCLNNDYIIMPLYFNSKKFDLVYNVDKDLMGFDPLT